MSDFKVSKPQEFYQPKELKGVVVQSLTRTAYLLNGPTGLAGHNDLSISLSSLPSMSKLEDTYWNKISN